MAECDIFLYIFTRQGIKGTLLNKSHFSTLLRNHLSNAVYVSNNIYGSLYLVTRIRRVVTHSTLFSKGMIIIIIITLLKGYKIQEWLNE
jgi:hypothetical protein